jgi:hypothetical protein
MKEIPSNNRMKCLAIVPMHRFNKWLGKKNLGFHLANNAVHST